MSKILVVDDERLSARMVQVLLEADGHEIIIAKNGLEGLEKAKTEKPDLIILDVMMPGINGLKVCRTLKNDFRYNKILIIILSTMGQEDDIKAGKEAGADAYIVKPSDGTVLLAKVEELLKSHDKIHL